MGDYKQDKRRQGRRNGSHWILETKILLWRLMNLEWYGRCIPLHVRRYW